MLRADVTPGVCYMARYLILASQALKSALHITRAILKDGDGERKIEVAGVHHRLDENYWGHSLRESWSISAEGLFEVNCIRFRYPDGRIRDVSFKISGLAAYATWLAMAHPDTAQSFGVEDAPSLSSYHAAGARWVLRKSAVPKREMTRLGIEPLGEVANMLLFSDTAAVVLKTSDHSLALERLA